MILGLGSDIIDIRRIEAAIARHGDRFLDRIFTPEERARAERRGERTRIATYARRFAAKEAAAKALGTGFNRGVFWRDIGVVNLPGSIPVHSSQLFGKNVANFLSLMVVDGALDTGVDDDVIKESMVASGGDVVNNRVREALGMEKLPEPEPPAPDPEPEPDETPAAEEAAK